MSKVKLQAYPSSIVTANFIKYLRSTGFTSRRLATCLKEWLEICNASLLKQFNSTGFISEGEADLYIEQQIESGTAISPAVKGERNLREIVFLTGANKKDESPEDLMRQLGYTDEQIEKLKKENDTEGR